jgi:hypothetical protein
MGSMGSLPVLSDPNVIFLPLSFQRIKDRYFQTMDILFNSLQVGPLTLPNRILMAPLTRCRASADVCDL